MLSVVLSPKSYTAHALTLSLYVLVAALAVGYAAVLGTSSWLDQQVPAEPSAQASTANVSFIVRWRWYWIPPLFVLALLFVWMITLTQSGGVGQLLYRGF